MTITFGQKIMRHVEARRAVMASECWKEQAKKNNGGCPPAQFATLNGDQARLAHACNLNAYYAQYFTDLFVVHPELKASFSGGISLSVEANPYTAGLPFYNISSPLGLFNRLITMRNAYGDDKYNGVKPFGPGKSLASCGSGLGCDVFAASILGGGVTGFEIDPDVWVIAKYLQESFGDIPGVSNVKLVNADFMGQEINRFDFYYVYLPTDIARRALGKIGNAAVSGAIVIGDHQDVSSSVLCSAWKMFDFGVWIKP